MTTGGRQTRKETFWQRNVRIIEWSMAVFVVFWGVWWSFFIEALVSARRHHMSLTGKLPREFFVVVIAIYATVFTYRFVLWLERICGFSSATHWKLRLRGLAQAIPEVAGLLMIAYAATPEFNLGLPRFLFGASLTVLWCMLNVALVTRGP